MYSVFNKLSEYIYFCISKNITSYFLKSPKAFSVSLRLDMSSLTEIQCLQTEPSEKGIHTNESMMLKMFYLYRFVK